MCSPHRGESVPLLSVEEADSFSVQRRECLLSTEDTPYVEMQRKYKPRELQNTGIRYITSTRDTRDVRDIRGTPASVWRNTYEIQAKRASEPKVYTYPPIHHRTGGGGPPPPPLQPQEGGGGTAEHSNIFIPNGLKSNNSYTQWPKYEKSLHPMA